MQLFAIFSSCSAEHRRKRKSFALSQWTAAELSNLLRLWSSLLNGNPLFRTYDGDYGEIPSQCHV